MSTLVAYENDGPRQRAEMVLDDGSRVRVALGGEGIMIELLSGPGGAHELLFRASLDLAAWVAVSFHEGGDPAPPILDLFVALVMRLGSVAAIRSAFAAAAATHRDFGGL
jgi:hypothetical protein